MGDAFGETFVTHRAAIAARATPATTPWRWTDDTAMALAIVGELAARADIDPDALAADFARRYLTEPWRGYGGTAQGILTAIGDGVPWRTATPEQRSKLQTEFKILLIRVYSGALA